MPPTDARHSAGTACAAVPTAAGTSPAAGDDHGPCHTSSGRMRAAEDTPSHGPQARFAGLEQVPNTLWWPCPGWAIAACQKHQVSKSLTRFSFFPTLVNVT